MIKLRRLSLIFPCLIICFGACSEKKDDVLSVPDTPNVTTTTQTVFVTSPVMSKANLISVSFLTDQILTAYGNDATKGYCFKSTDAGKTWTETPINLLYPIMNSLNFQDSNIGLVAGQTIYGTKDGGQTWAAVPSLSSEVIKIVYPKTNNAFFVKQIFDSVHGRKYSELYRFNTNTFTMETGYLSFDGYTNDLSFVKDKIGMLVGDKGLVNIIGVNPEGSFTFQDPINITTENLSSIAMISEKIAFVGGSNSFFSKTVNAGADWVTLKTTLPMGSNIKKIAFKNETTGYAIVENNGIVGVYKIENGGQQWTKLTTPDNSKFTDIQFNSQDKAVAVGNSGAVLLIN